MMQEQLSMYDALCPAPQLYECMKTCRHAMKNVDYPDWWFGSPRCLLADIQQVSFDNRSFAYCSRYERGDANA